MSAPEVMNGSTEVVSGGKTFITSKGVALHLTGISPLLIAKLQSVGTLPEVPTRDVPLDFDDGGVQKEPLSEKDLQDDEERKTWAEYIAERNKVLAKRNNGFMKAIFAKGVEVDLSRLDDWKRDMEYFEIEVPTHPLDQKVEFIQTEAIASSEDMVGIITGVLGESGLPEEELTNVRAMFRSSIRRRSAGQVVDSEGEMDVAPDVHGDESGEGVGSVASFEMVRSE